MYQRWRQRFEKHYGIGTLTFAALIVGGIIAAAVTPWLLFAPPTIDVDGQVGLLPGDYVARGDNRCSGEGRYADIQAKGKIRVTAGEWGVVGQLSTGHLLPSGRCEFPFRLSVPPGHGTYVFHLGDVARWTVTEAALARPLELTVDRSSSV